VESTSTHVRPRPEKIIDSLTAIVSKSEVELVFVTCIDDDGYVGDSEAYASTDKPKESLPMELLFSWPREQGIGTVMVTSRAAGPLESFADSDIAFTKVLIDEASARGIELLDHILVCDGQHRGMRATTNLWS
jgi:DNA repair protein RadC